MPYKIEDILNKSMSKAPAPPTTPTPPAASVVTATQEQEVQSNNSNNSTTNEITNEVSKSVAKKGYSILRHGNQEVVIKIDKKKSIKETIVSYKEKLGLPTLSSTTVGKLIRVYSTNGIKVNLEDTLNDESELMVFVNHKEKG